MLWVLLRNAQGGTSNEYQNICCCGKIKYQVEKKKEKKKGFIWSYAKYMTFTLICCCCCSAASCCGVTVIVCGCPPTIAVACMVGWFPVEAIIMKIIYMYKL